ncbi:MAG: Rrf2 family transcriptional regulator [Planctomycetota bacterium]
MTHSARMHYATLALVELARCREAGKLTAANEISDRQGIPGPFLVQILRTLRSAGWVQSVRGSQGGYRLSADPDDLTLLEIAETTGQTPGGFAGELGDNPVERKLQSVWDEASEASRQVLAQTTLTDLVEHCQDDGDVMFYI